jgi:hypothetical protein
MAKFAIVVADSQKHLAFERERYTTAFIEAGVPHQKAVSLASDRVGAARAVGHIHTEMDDVCPEGLPNCRNCGDPGFAAACEQAGHCPDCGTKHGIAPDAVLARHGFVLEPRN